MWTLNVKEKYYNMLKQGTKTIELRLFDDKRKNIKVADIIKFSNISNAEDNFLAQVVKLHRADNFEKLCNKINCHNAGFETNQELMKALEEFYSPERQKEFGVVGIEIKKID